jgi:hypothetical protein
MPDHGARTGDDFKSKSELVNSSISLLPKQRQLLVVGATRTEIPD